MNWTGFLSTNSLHRRSTGMGWVGRIGKGCVVCHAVVILNDDSMVTTERKKHVDDDDDGGDANKDLGSFYLPHMERY